MSRERDAFRAMMSVIVVGLIMLFSSGIFEPQLLYVHTSLVKRLLSVVSMRSNSAVTRMDE